MKINVEPHTKITLLSFLRTKSFKNCIYDIKTKNSTVSLLTKGFNSSTKKASPILVMFSGAIKREDNTFPPFFSGRGLSDEVRLPLVSISDPSLTANKNLALGWYAGNERIPDLQVIISRILTHFQKIQNSRLILIGGSGGGFAAAVQANLIKNNVHALIWNPQTNISTYHQPAVHQYIKSGFSQIDDNFSNDIPYNSATRLSKHNIIYDLKLQKRNINNLIVYLQNHSDSHLQKHLKPYSAKFSWDKVSKNLFQSKSNQILHISNWGEGHVPPPKEKIKQIISILATNITIDQTAEAILRLTANDAADIDSNITMDEIEDHITASIEQATGVIRIALSSQEIKNNKFKLALYTFSANKRIQTFKYQDLETFQVNQLDKITHITVFLKNSFGIIQKATFKISSIAIA